jgi:HK97 family phage prohead protease
MDLEQQFSQDRVEARSVPFTDVDTSNDGWTFEGLAAVYDQEADLGDFTESMARGSFRKSLARGENVPMLMEHNVDLPVLATTLGGTLSLSDDAKGLRVKANIAQHYVGEAVRELVKRGDIRGMSPGFIAGRGNSKIEHRGSKVHRTIVGFKKILDVSPTWEPAYTGTMAEMRSLRALQIAEDIEQVQQVLSGAAPQLENGAPVEQPEPVVSEGQEAVTPVDEAVCAECHSKALAACECVAEEGEQRSGVDSVEIEAAARKRRLQMLGLSLPR